MFEKMAYGYMYNGVIIISCKLQSFNDITLYTVRRYMYVLMISSAPGTNGNLLLILVVSTCKGADTFFILEMCCSDRYIYSI